MIFWIAIVCCFVILALGWLQYVRTHCVVSDCESYGRFTFWSCAIHTCTAEGCGGVSTKPNDECYSPCERRGCNTHRRFRSIYCKDHRCSFISESFVCYNAVTREASVCPIHQCDEIGCTNPGRPNRCENHSLCVIYKCDDMVVEGFDVCEVHLAEEGVDGKEIV